VNELAKNYTIPASDIEDAIRKPLTLVPAAWRPVVWEWWGGWSHLLHDQLPVTIRVRRWIAEGDLNLDDLRAAFAAIDDPQRAATLRYAGDLLAELTAEVARVVARRKSINDMLARRETPGDVDVNEIRARLAAALPRV
jgi:hypothetical protein